MISFVPCDLQCSLLWFELSLAVALCCISSERKHFLAQGEKIHFLQPVLKPLYWNRFFSFFFLFFFQGMAKTGNYCRRQIHMCITCTSGYKALQTEIGSVSGFLHLGLTSFGASTNQAVCWNFPLINYVFVLFSVQKQRFNFELLQSSWLKISLSGHGISALEIEIDNVLSK